MPGSDPSSPLVILVSDRRKYLPFLRSLGSLPGIFWALDRASQGQGSTPFKTVLENPPDLPSNALFYVDLPPHRVKKVVSFLEETYPRIPIILDRRCHEGEPHTTSHYIENVEEDLRLWTVRARELALVREKVEELLKLIAPIENLLILTHPNPDPDAIAASLGLRALLNRTKQRATLGYLGRPLSRPENLNMIHLLEIDLKRLEEEELKQYDGIVLVDCQENLFQEFQLPPITAVIDHHPEQIQYTAKYRDIVPAEGSTSTIITRYFQALKIEPSQRVATALLYGIKTDTFFLKREVNEDDILSFVYLYPRANINLLRRMEVPELEPQKVVLLGKALIESRVVHQVFVGVLPPHEEVSEDLIARLADLGLQVKGASWSMAVGFLDDAVILSVRNVGYVRHAGRALQNAFRGLGPAGGHRTSARAILDRKKLLQKMNREGDPDEIVDWILKQLLQEISPVEEGERNEAGAER
jgi:nanoRNase/pAp phosphatase (c-di-AMP/oligoRNAs hydrolase)